MAFLLCYHFHNAISHSITFPVAQNKYHIHCSHQPSVVTYYNSAFTHLQPHWTNDSSSDTHSTSVLASHNFVPPSLAQNVMPKCNLYSFWFMHYKTLLTFRKKPKPQNLYMNSSLCYVQCRSITYTKSYFTLSYNGNSAQFLFEYEQGIDKDK